jgi:hypothetical protein
MLAARIPSLINISGVDFNENLPLRNQPPVVNTIAGADDIQELIDNYEWVGQGGDAVSYGAYLRRAPLDGVEPKSVIIQFARGDRTLPNPTATAVLRAGDLADRATYYRFDLFLASNPTTPSFVNDPHGFHLPPAPFLTLPLEVRAALTAVAIAAQDQVGIFFASDGVEVIDPDGPGALFETPIVLPLPEDTVVLPVRRTSYSRWIGASRRTAVPWPSPRWCAGVGRERQGRVDGAVSEAGKRQQPSTTQLPARNSICEMAELSAMRTIHGLTQER